MEIERKYLIQKMPENLETVYEKKIIEQGYLCTAPVVRIRRSNDRYILTYKARVNTKGEIATEQSSTMQSGDTRINQEIEVPLTREAYLHLRDKVDGNLIQKIRYLIPLEDGHLGELDVFGGALEGLYFIEVEFADEDDAHMFVPPEWFGSNVSADHRYSNSYLSTCDGMQDFA